MGPPPDRLYMFGARHAELLREQLPKVKASTDIRVALEPLTCDVHVGHVVAVNPMFGINDYINYHADGSDTVTAVAGFCKRVAVETPHANADLFEEFHQFVVHWCGENLTPLAPSTDFDIETWLAATNYKETRKQQLRDIASTFVEPSRRERESCKSFVKDEFYDGIKHARTINARSDWFKAYCGPMFKQIEHELFQDPAFIKYVAVADRPDYIRKRMLGYSYVSTSDFKSFEGSFSPKMIRKIEGHMYMYMLSRCPDMQHRMHKVIKVMTSRNVLKFKGFKGSVSGVRMSGEMCTSLGNGFTNMMLMKFYCHKTNNDCISVFEGDDGLHLSREPFQEPTKFFAQLGFNLDFAKAASIQEAKFCGSRFDDNLNTHIDAVKVMLNTPWLKSIYHKANISTLKSLLKARAMSILYRCPNCPIVSSFAHWILRATVGVRARAEQGTPYMANLMREVFLKYKYSNPVISMSARCQYARTFGISVDDQLTLESLFDSQNELVQLSHPIFDDLFGHIRLRLAILYVHDTEWMVRNINDKNEKPKEAITSKAKCTITTPTSTQNQFAAIAAATCLIQRHV